MRKRFIAVLLALGMVLTLPGTAWAEELAQGHAAPTEAENFQSNDLSASVDDNVYENADDANNFYLPENTGEIMPKADILTYGVLSYRIINGVIEITDCNADVISVDIPSQINGYPVTKIGDYAFRDCGLTSITIPSSVTEIGDWAFYYCSSLMSVTIPNSVTEIGGAAFHSCSRLTSVTIPNSVTEIKNGTFHSCSGLTGVTIPSSVTVIGNSAFRYCSGLTSVTIPSSVTMIGDDTFEYCSGLTSVTIPSSVTTIGDGAFRHCSGLTSVTIPSSVTVIGTYTFAFCSGLTSVAIPSSVTVIGDYAFYYCSNLTSVTIPSSVTRIGVGAFYGCSGLTSMSIPSSVTEIGAVVFHNCSSLMDISVSPQNSMFSSENGVLFNKNGTTLICYPGGKVGAYSIPDHVTSIDSAFSGCSNLTSVTIPSSITEIGERAFQNCSGLTSVVIPRSVIYVGWNVFAGCDNLTDVYYSGSKSDWEAVEIDGHNDPLLNATIHYNSTGPDDVGNKSVNGVLRSGDTWKILWECIYKEDENGNPRNGKINITMTGSGNKDELYIYNENSSQGFPWELAPYNIPKSAIKSLTISGEMVGKRLRIAANSFQKYESLEKVLLDDVTGIDTYAFEGCSSLKSVGFLFAAEFASIGKGAFRNCTSLEQIDIPANLERIGEEAFQNTALKTITLGRNITEIGANAFAGCANLKIRCYENSVAHRYAVENNIPFELITEGIQIPCGGGVTETFNHDLDYLVANTISTTYSPELSHMLIALSNAAYDSGNISEAFSNLGFSNSRYNLIFITFNIGIKKQSDGSTLALVVIRGSEGTDWLSNFDMRLNSSRFHTGFADAAKEVYTNLEEEIGAENLSSTKFVITGHSRGAAVANLLEIKLSEIGVSNKNVYGYNFACPDVAVGLPTRWNWMGEHNNIFNINNAPDPISMVPGVIGGTINPIPGTSWGKFGQSFWFARNWSNLDELALDFSAHDQKQYLNYLRTKPSINIFRDWASRILALPAAQIQTIGKAIGICCPVDVIITDIDKNPLVSIVNGTVKHYDAAQTKILVFTEGDKKVIFVPGNTPLMVQLTATGSGTMDYTVQTIKFDSGEVVSQKTFASVSIDSGKQMLSMTDIESVTGIGTDVSKVPLYVLGSDGTPEKEVLPDGNGTEVPITNPDKPEQPDTPAPAYYTISFNANGGTVAPSSMTTDEHGKIALLPIPVRGGYKFNGWYTASIGGVLVDNGTIFSSNQTVYAQWTYTGGGGTTGGGTVVPSNPVIPSGNTTSPTYTISVPTTEGGSINVTPKSAAKGATIVITAMPDVGYELADIVVTDNDGKPIELTDKGNGKYSFTMPAGKITIDATFQTQETKPNLGINWDNPFIDVTDGAWYYDAVRFVSENSLMNGTSNSMFEPDVQLSRAMLAQILYNKEGKPSTTGNSRFLDVGNNRWYADAVIWAAENHIVNGYGDALFGPDNQITREQLAVMLWRYAGEPTTANQELHFIDADDSSDYALEALNWAVGSGIINGHSNGELAPKGEATRAQVAQMLKNYLNK